MATILHISADYPDTLAPTKTRAISRLVEGTPEHRHVVYSINRVDGWSGLAATPFGEDRVAIAYKALPKGLLWERRLHELAQWIRQDAEGRNIRPDLVQAHKFTVEGLIGQELADGFACPLICDIQGNTDVRILKRKPGLRRRYRQIAERSALVFAYAPWALPPFQQLTGLDPAKCRTLPVVPALDSMRASAPAGERLLSVFHLDHWRLKNLQGLVSAMETLAEKRPGLTLDVFGGGGPKTLLAAENLLARSSAGQRIRLMGPVENGRLPEVMQDYAGFVMPSLSESYGLVYAEALFSGLPVLFSKGRGIDGYFDPNDIGYACDPSSAQDIAAGMEYLLANQQALKAGIARMQSERRLDFIRREAILQRYRGGIRDALLQGQAAHPMESL